MKREGLRIFGDSSEAVDNFLPDGVGVDLANDFNVGAAVGERRAFVGVGNVGRVAANFVDGKGLDR